MKLPGGLDAAKEHLDAAAKSPEREMLLKAFKLREQVKKFGDEAAALGLGSEVERLLQYKPTGSLAGRPMTEWRDDLVEGQSVIRVIDDVDELEHLCERLAPGAEEDVGWNEDMRHLCGRECVIDCLNDECRAYGVGCYRSRSRRILVRVHVSFLGGPTRACSASLFPIRLAPR